MISSRAVKHSENQSTLMLAVLPVIGHSAQSQEGRDVVGNGIEHESELAPQPHKLNPEAATSHSVESNEELLNAMRNDARASQEAAPAPGVGDGRDTVH